MEREHKPRARWKTISLRGLLVLILAIALWLGWIVHKARQQREAVAALQKFGAVVYYDWEFVDGPVKGPWSNQLWGPTWGTLTPGRTPWAPDWLRRVVGDEYFQSLAHVCFSVDTKKGEAPDWGAADEALRKLSTQTSVRTLQLGADLATDDNLADVGRMTGLEELSISWGYNLTDGGFQHLSGLRRLRILDLDHSKMTDAGLGAIGKLTNLEELRIAGAGFSDRGLAQLEGLTRLRFLSLGEGNQTISDAGPESLKNMKALEYLDLGGWHLSDEGIAKLRELKNLKTVRIYMPADGGDRRKRLQKLLPGVVIE